MKLLSLLASLFLFVGLSQYSSGQVFWTETFGSGCNSGTLADGAVTSNGTWNVTATGVNGADANVWYISAEENAEGVGNCGAGCGTNPTLHIGRADGDVGATYLKDNATGDPITDVRVESPVIDCSNECQIVMSFDLIHNGDLLLDNCVMWYFDGSTWAPLGSPKKTVLTCAPVGTWEDYSIALPASASNNPNVRIGFHFQCIYLWDSHGTTTGRPRDNRGTATGNHGITMGQRRDNDGRITGQPWDNRETACLVGVIG